MRPVKVRKNSGPLRFFRRQRVNSNSSNDIDSFESNSSQSSSLDEGLNEIPKVGNTGSKRTRQASRTRFEGCCKELIDVLNPGVCNRLADYFELAIDQKAFPKSHLVSVFVETLREAGLLNPNDITRLEYGLKHIGEEKLASRVEDIFGGWSGVEQLTSPGCNRENTELRTRFEGCCKELLDVLNPDVCNKLADYFEFTANQKAFRKSENFVNVFIETLKEARLIKPNYSTLLEHGLKHVGEKNLAHRVNHIFKEPLEAGGLTLSDLFWQFSNFLKRHYSYRCKDVRRFLGHNEQTFSINELFVEGRFEVLISENHTNGMKIWKGITSYRDIVSIASQNEKVVVEGNGGCGKSMLMLQLVHEWIQNDESSAMSQMDLVIFLPLENVDGDPNIYHAIKRVLLPDETDIDEERVENIIRYSNSVIFLLDGFDKVTEKRNQWISKFLVNEATEKKFSVVLTTRPHIVPRKYLQSMQQFRLCGFDSTAKEMYKHKVLCACNKAKDEKAYNKISSFVDRAIISDIPLLFFTVPLLICQENVSDDPGTLTSVFYYVMKLIVGFVDISSGTDLKFENFSKGSNQCSFEEFAYSILVNAEETMDFTKEEMISRIGMQQYNFYTNLGVLQEKRVYLYKHELQPPDFDSFKWRTDVEFYEIIFCEWFAALYIVQNTNRDMLKYLQLISPIRFPNVFRFCCGLKSSDGKLVSDLTNHLHQYKGGEAFALLCNLEQEASLTNTIKQELIDICSKGVELRAEDGKLQQRSTIELVELASTYEIPVARLALKNCLDFSQFDDERLILLSGELLATHRLSHVKIIRVAEQVRRLDHRQTEKIINFARNCCRLKILIFSDCLPPWRITMDVQRKQGDIKVTWFTKKLEIYRLDDSGKWMVRGQELPIQDYNKEVSYFEKKHITQTSSRERRDDKSGPDLGGTKSVTHPTENTGGAGRSTSNGSTNKKISKIKLKKYKI